VHQEHGLGSAWGNETDRAAVLVFDPAGRNRRVFASGLRNCVGLALHPMTGDLWCSTNERDDLGDDLVPDFITRVRDGAFYGWPWYYLGANEDPRHPTGERSLPLEGLHCLFRGTEGAEGYISRCEGLECVWAMF
jgi:glucose/arabinose dehydrogenase